MEKDLSIVKNLIKAMSDYGMEYSWTDSDIIDTLIDCGITKQDFIDCGYGDFVKNYFKNS